MMMRMNGLEFVFAELDKLQAGVCAACGRALTLPRTREFTCDDQCHARWLDRLVAELGAERIITDGVTGRRYVVPTRVILDKGITYETLMTFPEAP
jgi:hypothetical protein